LPSADSRPEGTLNRLEELRDSFGGFEPKEILIRGANWVGDAIMTLPAVAALSQNFPQARLTVMTRPWAAGAYQGQAGISEMIPDGGQGGLKALIERVRLAGVLKKRRFDLALLFQNAFSAALTTALAGIPHRWGFARDGRALLLTRPVKLIPSDAYYHESFYYLNLLERLGLKAPFRQPRLVVDPAAAREALNILKNAGAGDWSTPLILAPGAAFGSAKRWPARNFALAAAKITRQRPSGVIILGGVNEKEIAREVAAGLSGPVLNLAGRTSLAVSMAVMAHGGLLISNDSGLMHLGGALGVPLTAVFGPTNPLTTAPLGQARLIRSRAACAPCLKRDCPLERQICFDELSPDKVAEAALSLIEPAQSSPGLTPAVFLDRDGTINLEVGFLDRPERLELIAGAGRAIAELNRAGFRVVVVTNQSGLARGLFSYADLELIHNRLRELLALEGANLDGIYFCPHHPEGSLPELSRVCDCRKPSSGLYEQAAAELKIDLARSVWVGDRQRDFLAAEKFGGRSVLVLTGYGLQEAQQTLEHQPTLVAPDLKRAVEWIVS